MIKYVGGGLWVAGVLLMMIDSVIGGVHQSYLFGMAMLAIISLYNYFFGRQKGHPAHLLFLLVFFLIGAFLTLHLLGIISTRAIFIALAPIILLIIFVVLRYRKAFYEDFFADRRRDHFDLNRKKE